MGGKSVFRMMSDYYEYVFPYQEMFDWLAYGHDGKHPAADPSFPKRREICLTLGGADGTDEIFARYQSYADAASLKQALVKKCPIKIDIGPVYSRDPTTRKQYPDFHPLERELVFDIDMDGYDDVRLCCQGNKLCTSCWPLMTMGVSVMDHVLREDFGFEHILWVFSGRRGIHGWVCDPAARRLSDANRSAIARYLECYKGNQDGRAKMSEDAHHPSVKASYALLKEHFEKSYLPAQQLLETPDGIERVLQYVPHEDVRDRMRTKWGSSRPGSKAAPDTSHLSLSTQRWLELEAEVKKTADKINKSAGLGAAQREKELVGSLRNIVMAFCYPRLDVEVSKKMNHLLKAPFCVHPKTGRVCVPINPKTMWKFTPEKVVHVETLVQEIHSKRAQGEKHPDWRVTSLAPEVKYFSQEFLAGCKKSAQEEMTQRTREQRREVQTRMDF
jgi:DNA primase small subunit